MKFLTSYICATFSAILILGLPIFDFVFDSDEFIVEWPFFVLGTTVFSLFGCTIGAFLFFLAGEKMMRFWVGISSFFVLGLGYGFLITVVTDDKFNFLYFILATVGSLVFYFIRLILEKSEYA